MSKKQGKDNEIAEFEADLAKNMEKPSKNSDIHPFDSKIAEFAQELLEMVIKANGTQIQSWNTSFVVQLGHVRTTIDVKYELGN